MRYLTMTLPLVGAVWLASCSLVLDWSPEGLFCQDGVCAEDFSCLVNQCISDGSLEKGETCNQDVQCNGDLICAPNLFTCRDPCASSSFYRASTDCATGEYCHPFPEEDNETWVGVCVPSAGCTSDADCNEDGSGQFCVKITTTAFACLDGCEINVLEPENFDDTCGGTSVEPKYCQPVGARGAERLVCLDTNINASQDRSPCKPVDAPCKDEGLACVDGQCKNYCDPGASPSQCESSDPTEVCCTRTTASGEEYGICETTDVGCGL